MKTSIKTFEYYCANNSCHKWTRVSLPTDESGAALRAVRCCGCKKPLGHDFCPGCSAFHPRHDDLSESTYCPLCGTELEHGVGAIEENQAIRNWKFMLFGIGIYLCVGKFIFQNPTVLQWMSHVNQWESEFIKRHQPDNFMLGFLLVFFPLALLTGMFGVSLPIWLAPVYTLVTGKRGDALEIEVVTDDPFRSGLILGMRQCRHLTRKAMYLRRCLKRYRHAAKRLVYEQISRHSEKA